jgi:hypothetical protein
MSSRPSELNGPIGPAAALRRLGLTLRETPGVRFALLAVGLGEELRARSALCRQRMTSGGRALRVSLHGSSILRFAATRRTLQPMVFRTAVAVAGYGRITARVIRTARALLRLRAA